MQNNAQKIKALKQNAKYQYAKRWC